MDKLFFNKTIDNKNGTIFVSLINGLRRTIMCDIDVYCIDMDSTQFYENTCVLDNEFLSKRLSLVPIISDYEDVVYENVRIECKIKNNSQDMKSIYISDFQFKDDSKSDQSAQRAKIDEKDNLIQKEFCRFPEILFTKLKPNQSISFEARLKKNNSQYGGANYNPTCPCVHTFEIDESRLQSKIKEENMNESQARTFVLDEAETYYKVAPNGAPGVYKLHIESVGHLNAETIYKMGIEKLKERILIAKSEMNLKNSEKVSITKNKKSDEVFDVVFMDENDTLGNILSEYLSIDEDVKYVGYRLVHPLKYEMHMKIVLYKDNDKEHIAKKYIETMNKILKLIEVI
jgi:DNA-directed RNA polymerase subunit L